MIGPSSTTEEHKFRATVEVFFAFVEDESDPVRILLIAPQGNPVTVKLSRCVQRGADGRNFTVPEILSAGWRNQAARGRRRVPQAGLDALAIAEHNKNSTKKARSARAFFMMSVWFDRSG
jgi:hypothetical protein